MRRASPNGRSRQAFAHVTSLDAGKPLRDITEFHVDRKHALVILHGCRRLVQGFRGVPQQLQYAHKLFVTGARLIQGATEYRRRDLHLLLLEKALT